MRFISGMVKMPPETTLETEEPETTPFSAEDTTATLAGPPRRWPSRAIEICIIQLPAPALSSRVPNSTNRKTKLVETPSAMPKMPSVVSHWCCRNLVEGRALVLHHLGHPGAGEGEHHEQDGDADHGQAQRPPRRLQQQQDAGAGGDQVERGRLARALRQLAVEQEQIGAGEGAEDGQDPVDRRHPVAPRPGEGEIGGEGQEQGEAEMDRPRLGVVEHAEADPEGQGEAYHSWNSDQAMATPASSVAAAPAGLRPPVSASATSCSSSALGCSPGVSVMTASPCLLMLEVDERSDEEAVLFIRQCRA